MSQKIASASAFGSTTGAFRAICAASTGRHSSPPAWTRDQLVPVDETISAITTVGRIKRWMRRMEDWEFIVLHNAMILQSWEPSHLCFLRFFAAYSSFANANYYRRSAAVYRCAEFSWTHNTKHGPATDGVCAGWSDPGAGKGAGFDLASSC